MDRDTRYYTIMWAKSIFAGILTQLMIVLTNGIVPYGFDPVLAWRWSFLSYVLALSYGIGLSRVLKPTEMAITYTDKDEFFTKAQSTFEMMNYFLYSNVDNILLFKARFLFSFMFDPVSIKLEDGVATVSGPCDAVETIKWKVTGVKPKKARIKIDDPKLESLELKNLNWITFFWLKWMIIWYAVGQIAARITKFVLIANLAQPLRVIMFRSSMAFNEAMFAGIIIGILVSRGMKHIISELQYSDEDKFVVDINSILQRQNYDLVYNEGSMLVFKPKFPTSFIYNNLTIKLSEGKATVDGPSRYVELIQKNLTNR